MRLVRVVGDYVIISRLADGLNYEVDALRLGELVIVDLLENRADERIIVLLRDGTLWETSFPANFFAPA